MLSAVLKVQDEIELVGHLVGKDRRISSKNGYAGEKAARDLLLKNPGNVLFKLVTLPESVVKIAMHSSVYMFTWDGTAGEK